MIPGGLRIMDRNASASLICESGINDAVQTHTGFSGFDSKATVNFRWDANYEFPTVLSSRNRNRNIFSRADHILYTLTDK